MNRRHDSAAFSTALLSGVDAVAVVLVVVSVVGVVDTASVRVR